MLKRYIMIIVVYVVCQLSGLLAYTPLLSGIPKHQRVGVMICISFIVCLVATLWLLLPERINLSEKRPPMATNTIVSWCFAGIVMVYFVQIIAGLIDYKLFGAPNHSKNTEQIMKLALQSPYVILVVVIIGPILEEIIFRKIIFGSLYKKLNFWIAGIISALLFAFAHNDGHLIIYGSIGLVLAYLYAKTKRIYVSMIAHGSLNGIATLLSLSPHVQHLLQNSQHTGWIGGWF
ncbi:MAG TPA: type II CAAX endopeptidase family protein [Sporolactobacillaceae bacterium]|nr:type II CAAX endopeptidase family protein [Sporolactobacillaceae bacterium]